MTLNEIKNYDIRAYGSRVSLLNNHPYKARGASGKLILTAPFAEPGKCYVDRVNDEGVITYIPLGEIPLDVFAKEELHICKTLRSGKGFALNARFAKPGAYYYATINGLGVITYTPTNIARNNWNHILLSSDLCKERDE